MILESLIFFVFLLQNDTISLSLFQICDGEIEKMFNFLQDDSLRQLQGCLYNRGHWSNAGVDKIVTRSG